jgi:hypothetical protein
MPPPTIARLKSMGITAFTTTCSACRHSGKITFQAALVDDAELFPSIVERRRFVCTKCGSHDVSVMPDWSGHKATGLGKSIEEA